MTSIISSVIYGVDPDNIDYLENQYVVDEGDNSNYLEFVNFFETNDLSLPENYEEMGRRMDIDNFVDYQVTEIFVNNNDWPQNNLEYWRARVPFNPNAPKGQDGRWRWVIKDLDRSFGRVIPDDFNMMNWATNGSSNWATSLFRNLLKNDEFKHKFINRMADQLNSGFRKERILQLVDSIQTIMQPEVPEHTRRWNQPSSLNAWLNRIQEVKNFVAVREGFVRQHISDYFGLGGSATVRLQVSDPQAGFVQINSIAIKNGTTGLQEGALYPWTGTYFKNVPITLKALPNPGYTLSHWVINGAVDARQEASFVLTADSQVTAVFVSSNRFATSLVSPQNNSFGAGANPNFVWTTVPNVSSYRLQVSLTPGMDQLVFDQSGLTGTSQSVTGLDLNQIYYWWVISTNASGQQDWSGVWRFSTAAEGVLSTPVLVGPANNSQDVPMSLTFVWNEVFGADRYQLQVSKDNTFTDMIVDATNLVTTSYLLSGLEKDTFYYWRVKAFRQGFESSFSATGQFKTVNMPDLLEDMVGHWKMDEGTGSILVDHSGNGHNAALQNTSGVTWSNGVIGLALNLNGLSGRYALVSHQTSLAFGNALTISAWIKPNTLGRHTIISKADGNGYELWLDINGKIEFRLNRGNNNTAYRLLSNFNYSGSIGQWIHVAATFDGRTMKIFVNGNPDISATFAPFGFTTNSGSLTIGALGTIQRLNGSLDDLRLFKRALRDQEIRTLYSGEPILPEVPTLATPSSGTGIANVTTLDLAWNPSENATGYQIQVAYDGGFEDLILEEEVGSQNSATVSNLIPETTYFWRVRASNDAGYSEWSDTWNFNILSGGPQTDGLVGHWKMDEGSGNLFIDDSGNENDAVIQNTGGVLWSQGVIGQAVNLNGQSGRFAIAPHSPSLEIENAITIAAWVKPNSLHRGTIVQKSSGNGFEFWLDTNGQLEFRLNRGNNGSTYRIRSSYSYSQDVGKWIHLAATFDGTTSKIYVNGVENVSASYAPFTIGTNSGNLVIGALGTIQRLNGAMDDLRLYERALSGGEILALMNVDVTLPETPQLVSPANNATGISAASVELVWANALFANGYSVQVATTAGFSTLIVDADVGNMLRFTPTGLLPATAYFWRVRAYNDEGESPWSATRTFTTAAAGPEPNGLAGHWKMDEGSGNLFVDDSGNGNNAVIQNTGGISWSSGQIGQAVNLNGLSGRFGVAPHSTSLELPNAITISAWVKPNTLHRGTLIQKENGNGFEFWLDSNGQLEFRLNRGNNGSTYRLRSNYNYTNFLGTWIHLAATFDGITSRIYVNGVENISATYAPFTIGTNSGNLVIGALGTIQRLNGAMDDLRLYGRALSPVEIEQLASPSQAMRIAGAERGDNSSNPDEENDINLSEMLVGLEKPSILFPNPVDDVLQVRVFGYQDASIGVSIVDARGIPILDKAIEVQNGILRIDVGELNLKSGIHVLLLKHERTIETLKFLKK
jgi:hypothetical protein